MKILSGAMIIYRCVYLLPLFLSICLPVAAQNLKWEKVLSGQKTVETDTIKRFQQYFGDSDFNLGSKSVPSPRHSSSGCQDSDGNLWLFSGMGFNEKGNWGLFKDLWKYSPEKNTWDLLSGNVGDLFPAARRKGLTWIDKSGNFWLYGGQPVNDDEFFGDMWMFNVTNKQWNPINGKADFNQLAYWGGLKKSETGNTPGSRSGSVTWSDGTGNLWLFGGKGTNYKNGAQEFYNDIWKFEIKTSQWVWVGGNNKFNGTSSFSSKEKEGTKPVPSSRCDAAFVYEKEADKIWIYGGYGTDSTGLNTGSLGDLWSYDSKKETWLWESGTNNLDPFNADQNVNRKKYTPVSPGIRVKSSLWRDNTGNLYLFGGQSIMTFDRIDVNPIVWIYSSKFRKWIATLPENAANIKDGAIAFNDKSGNLFLFGGEKFNRKSLKTYPSNEIWKIVSEK